MISYEEARVLVLEAVGALGGERVPLSVARGRVLRQPETARIDLPPFDNSAVDGYAVRCPVTNPLRLVGAVAAGDDATTFEVGEGEAFRIFTGAPVPPGADAVVMQEDVEREGSTVRVLSLPSDGDHIRRRGDEITQGRPLLPTPLLVTPSVIGALAMAGCDEVEVFRRPRVAVIETGNELCTPGSELKPGQVYASNGAALGAAAEALGAQVALFRTGDDPSAMRDTFSRAFEAADLVVTSGGVSVGEHDLVRPTCQDLGVRERFWRVAIKPGKPVSFGSVENGPLVLSLPGNPVSSLVTFLLFGRPLLLKMMGLTDAPPERWVAGAPMRGSIGRDEFVRVSLQGSSAFPLERQGSHMVSGLALADGLVRLPAGTQMLEPGESVCGLRIEWGLPSGLASLAPDLLL